MQFVNLLSVNRCRVGIISVYSKLFWLYMGVTFINITEASLLIVFLLLYLYILLKTKKFCNIQMWELLVSKQRKFCTECTDWKNQ